MKKILVGLLIGLIAGAMVMFFVIKGTSPGGKIASAEKTSFSEVAAKLDPNGNGYFYLRTDQIMQGVEKLIQFLSGLSQSVPVPDKAKEIALAGDVLKKIWKISGIDAIDGIGGSSITIEPGLYRSRFVVHHPAEKGDGIIWNFSQKEPQPLTEISYFPDDTVIAAFSEMQLQKIWERVKNEASKSEWKEVLEGMKKAEEMIGNQDVDWNKLLKGFQGRFGYLLCLDKEKTFQVPGPKPIGIPEPSLAFFMTVNDSYLFDLIAKKAPTGEQKEEKGVKRVEFLLPPLPVPLQPVMAQKGNMLILASSGRLLDRMLEAAANGKGLTSTEEYRRLSRHLPTKGNDFGWFSQRFLNSLATVLKQKDLASGDEKSAQMLAMMGDLFSKPFASCQVGEHHADGIVKTSNSTFSLMEVIEIVQKIAAAGIQEAMSTGQQSKTLASLRNASNAVESYLIDYSRLPDGDSWVEMKSQLEPFYIKKFPQSDAWGNNLMFKRGEQADQYMLASVGKDGVFSGWDQRGFYPLSTKECDKDIIYANGEMVFGPRKQ